MKITARLAGGSFRPKDDRDHTEKLRVGTELTLQRERDNTNDRNAIKVWNARRFIGYVERAYAAQVAAAIDAGGEVTATVYAAQANRDPLMMEITLP